MYANIPVYRDFPQPLEEETVRVNKNVFFTSAFLITFFVFMGAVYTEATYAWTTGLQDFIVTNLGWSYTLLIAFLIGFVAWLPFSRYAHVTLGKDGEEAKYPYPSWFAMLFSAGIGIALLYFGVAEPLEYYANPPTGEAGTPEAARRAVSLTYFHWGLHGWAIYATVGLSLAYFGYRHDLPLTFRSTLYPILGEDIHGPIGDAVEVLAVIGTMFGVAPSLGLGVMHVNAGLHHIGWVSEVSTYWQLMLIGGITLAATISVVSGLDKGIRRLSEINFGLGLVLLAFVFVTGPTVFLVRAMIEDVGFYFQNIVQRTFITGAFAETMEWQKSWTLFYWGWWISWSPFVGMFIARISRGRTIREFVAGVILVPTAFIFLWMGIFGNTGIYLQREMGVALSDAELFHRFYITLEHLPLTVLSTAVATASGMIYFVTSSDSASLVIDILTSGGDTDPPVSQRVFWATLEGCVAGVLLYAGGKEALKALQAATLSAGLPFAVVIVAICYSLVKGLREAEGEGTLDDIEQSDLN